MQNYINVVVRGANIYYCAFSDEKAQLFPLTIKSYFPEHILVRKVMHSSTHVSTLRWNLILPASG